MLWANSFGAKWAASDGRMLIRATGEAACCYGSVFSADAGKPMVATIWRNAGSP